MTKHRFLALFALAGLGLAVAASASRADRLIFSEVGYPVLSDPGDEFSLTVAPAPLVFNSVPMIQMQVGEERTLSIWLRAEAPNHSYSSVGYDIDSSNGAVAHLIARTTSNPTNNEGAQRWDGVVPGNVGAVGSTDLLTDVRAAGIFSASIGTPSAANRPDPGRDNNTVSFYLGDITLRADAIGTTGLYFRNGAATNYLRPIGTTPARPAELKFGASSTVYMGDQIGVGDPITLDLLEADAIIQVVSGGGGGPTVMRTAHDGTDTAGDVVFNSVRNTFKGAGGATSGRINILNYLGDGSGDLPLFFDLVDGANAQQLVNDLNAAANGQYTAALSSFSAPNAAGGGSSTADIEVRYAGVPAGGNFFIDFNFGNVGVAAVGVPEPSSLALVGMGLIGLVGYGIRRRRSA